MEQLSVTLKNGETYFYYQTISKDKPHLLLIHGNTSSGIFFEPLIKKLRKDFNLLVPDLRGFGNSSYLKPIESFKDFGHDLKELLEALKIEKVYTLGWSLGGNVALEFSALYPDLTEKLILLSSGSVKGYPIFKKQENGLPIFTEIYPNKEELKEDKVQVVPLLNAQQNSDLNFMEYIYNLTIYTGPKKPDQEDNTRWLTEALKQRNLVDVDWALATFNITNEPSLYSKGTDQLKDIKVPILNIWGNKDVVVPEVMFRENERLLLHAKHIVYEDAGHSIIVDQLDKLVEDIKIFLK